MDAGLIKALWELEKKATPGPWAWLPTGDKDDSWGLGQVASDDDKLLADQIEKGQGTVVAAIAISVEDLANQYDPALICAMRNALPDLLDATESEQRLPQACTLCRQNDAEMKAEMEGQLHAAEITVNLQKHIANQALLDLAASQERLKRVDENNEGLRGLLGSDYLRDHERAVNELAVSQAVEQKLQRVRSIAGRIWATCASILPDDVRLALARSLDALREGER